MAGRPGYHYRRGGWVKNPTPKAKTSGKWIAWAVAAVLVYTALHSCFSSSAAQPSTPTKAAVSTSPSPTR